MDGVRLIRDYSMNGVVAHEEGVRKAVDLAATIIGDKAKERLKRHRDEGNAYVEVEHNFPGKYGDIDSLVWLIDNPHQRADGTWSEGNAWSIEFGHVHNWTGKYIPGLYILYGAAGLV